LESLTVKGHNLFSVEEIVRAVKRVKGAKKISTVSVTGGEPLTQAGFLRDLLPALRKNKYRVYLETAGVHAKNLASIISYVDVVAMDMKLPSAVGRTYWKEHKEFLKVAAKKAFVKIVIDSKSTLSEVRQAAHIIKSNSVQPLLVLQPATSIASRTRAPSSEQISAAYNLASSVLKRVLVMPQQHKLWSVR
jgi:organic radical activating enzyme